MKKLVISLLSLSLIVPTLALSKTEINTEQVKQEDKISKDFSFDVSVYKVKSNNKDNEFPLATKIFETKSDEVLKNFGELIFNAKDVKSRGGKLSIANTKEVEYIASVATNKNKEKTIKKDIIEDGFNLSIEQSNGDYTISLNQNNIKAIEKFTTNGDTIELPQMSTWTFKSTAKVSLNESFIIKSNNYQNNEETYYNVYVLTSK